MSPLIREFVQAVDDREWQSSLFSLLQNQTYNQCEVDLFELMCKVLDQNLFSQVDWARNSIFFKDLKVSFVHHISNFSSIICSKVCSRSPNHFFYLLLEHRATEAENLPSRGIDAKDEWAIHSLDGVHFCFYFCTMGTKWYQRCHAKPHAPIQTCLNAPLKMIALFNSLSYRNFCFCKQIG